MNATTGYEAPTPRDKARITPEYVQGLIRGAEYHVFPGSKMTVCCLTLKNGFQVEGSSACVYRENFDPEMGMEIARRKAVGKIYELEAYLMQEGIHRDREASKAALNGSPTNVTAWG